MTNFDAYYNIVMEAVLGARIDPSSQKAMRDIGVGQKAEDVFKDICKKNRLRATPASLDQERNHIDFSVFQGNDRAWENRPENQGISKNSRNLVEVKDEKRNNGNFIVEILNVRGDFGWLYGGANYIAIFDSSKNGFKMVKRFKLQKEIEKLAEFKMNGRVPTDIKTNQPVKVVQDKNLSNIYDKTFYQRGQDLVIYVPYDIIDSLVEFVLS